MHNFDDLVYRSTSFTLHALEKANDQVLRALEESAPTSAIKNLQMLQLQKVILATGMFSLFDAILQEGFACRNGFVKAKAILIQRREVELHNRFEDFIRAINVLKHGRGESYNSLVAKFESLPFKIKLPDQNFFYEGDVSEVSTLVEVTDKFVLDCAELIGQVSAVMRKEFAGFAL